ncbi:hypothetical protein [Mailhella sp.]|uniref:hypothetical protein n=1 Tax=Mailhella sp. TaxID=1981029 RepID=UPI004062D343
MIVRRPFPILPSCVSLAGLLFCLWVHLTGGESLCLTDGCALFQDFRLAGVSLWQAGLVLFSLLLALCLLRFIRAARFCAALALTADTLLLGVMLFTAPCVNCLIAALFIAAAFVALRRADSSNRRTRRSPLLLLWAALFLFALGGVIRDSAEPWSPLPQEGPASVHIYFSPSCRACQTLAELAPRMKGARWFPVAEDARDVWLIRAMGDALAAGATLPEAVKQAQNAVPGLADFDSAPGWRLGLLKPEMLLLQFRLWKNHARVLAAGSDRLPFVQYLGLPAFLRGDALPLPSVSPNIPELDLGVTAFCPGEKGRTPDGAAPASCSETPRAPAKTSPAQGLIDTSGMAP